MSRPAPSVALFTDLYELTMAQAYWQSGHVAPATFSFFFRKYPPDRAYFVCAGLADVLAYLERFRFAAADLDYLRSLGRFDGGFLDWLGRLRFTGSVRAMMEGALFFTHEPVLEVTAPVIEAQLVETFLVNQLHFQTLLATKAARVRYAAGERLVIDFAARRAHGVEAADRLARVSYLAGFDGTSNTLAGARYGIPVYGTMAHSFVTAFASEAESFRAYARSFPDSSTLLVDTYDTLAGTRKAIAVARELREQGHQLQALRLDSGDLAALAREARVLLDGAGFPEVRLFASGGLDEYEVEALVQGGAPIDGFGVGTKVGVSADAPLADCAYKLVAYDGRPVLKLSPGKQTLPGPKQVYRFCDDEGSWLRDVIAPHPNPPPPVGGGQGGGGEPGGQPLLAEVMREGKRLRPDPALAELRRDFREQFARLPECHKALRSPAPYEVGLSAELERLRDDVVRQVTERERSA